METVASVEETKQKRVDTRTPAQKAFDRVQRKRVSERHYDLSSERL